MTTAASAQPRLALADLGPHAFVYEACDIPPGMTIDEFRSQRFGARKNAHRPALLRRLRSRQSVDASSDAPVDDGVGDAKIRNRLGVLQAVWR